MDTNFQTTGIHVSAKRQRTMAVCLAIALVTLAHGQSAIETALQQTYTQPTIISQGFGVRWNAFTEYTAAAFKDRQGPDLVIVREEAGGLPVPTFRLRASLHEEITPLNAIDRFSRYEVDRLEVVTVSDDYLGSRTAWAIARLTCDCSGQIVFISIEPIGQLNIVKVGLLVLDKSETPYKVRELGQTPSATRSLLGLAAIDGLVEVSSDSAIEPLNFKSWFGNFVPDPNSDCVACAPVFRHRDPIDVYLARHFGSVDVVNRTPQVDWPKGRFVTVIVHPFTRLTDTLVVHEQNDRVSVLYQYSHTVIPELSRPNPQDGHYLWPDRLVDVDLDGFPELIGHEVCHCDAGNSYFAVFNLRDSEAVFVEYTGGTNWGPGPDVLVPYIRPLTSPNPENARMQEELLSYVMRLSLERAREPADSQPLGLTNDIRLGRLVPLR